MVQPNCGEQKCLKRNPGGLQGWTIKRPKRQKPKPKPKPNPNLTPREVKGRNEADLRRTNLQRREEKKELKANDLVPTSKALTYSL